ncbi:D-alanyl-D-alanine carboxypeptidase [Streptomyces ziwulingensis]|uniref:D-alanyl-D-alanine carboxypeptidase n=1 Tax=Streptomyces ziwulingensis TaxID=1045501 RepID=UPI0031E93337
MAGESPDRSKQRESSTERTSGSAGPVPEARTEPDGARDPRLAVARESGPEVRRSASGGAAVDTATRVRAVSDGGTEPAAAGDGDGSGTPRDGRLQEAVAAWVRPGPADGDVGAEGDAGGAKSPQKPGKAVTGAQEAREGRDAQGGTEKDVVASGGNGDGAEGDGEGEGADSEAAAGSAADDVEPNGDSEADAEADVKPDVEAEAEAGSESGAAATTDAEPKPDAKPEAEAEPEPEAEPESASEPGPDVPAKTAKPATTAEPEDAPPTDEPADDATSDTDITTGATPTDQPTAVFKAPRPAAPPVDQPTTMLKLGDVPAKAEKTGTADEADAADEAGEETEDVKDVKGEAPAERTSKFVALKPLDEPATRKAPPAADDTAALPASAAAPAHPERTSQQPLPPKPPLDLLAELTNTPPPPETALRTAVRRVKIWTPLVLLMLVVLGVVQTVRPLPAPTLDLTAEESFTFDGAKAGIAWPAEGQAALDVQGIGSFGSSGEQRPVPIASVAKVMTTYLILKDHPLKSGAEGPKINIDQTAEDQSDAGDESTVEVFKGDSITQREALEGVLIASANNVARLLARWDAGSEKAFVAKMNDAAKDLGMADTTYTDPSGLNNTTVSTAVDQVKLAKAAMKQPAFREVAAMMSYVDYKGAKHNNWNQLVGYNDVVGIKTGTTTSALGNLVFAAKKEVDGETRTIVGAVVRQPAGGSDNTILQGALSAGDKLVRAAQDALKSATILKKGDVVGYVDDGLGGRTPVVATQNVKAVGWAGLTVKLTFTADEVPHTAKAGTKVGALTVGDGGTSGAVKVPVALQRDLVEPGFTDKLTRLG